IRDLGAVVSTVEGAVVLVEHARRIGETGSGMPDLVAQLLLPPGEVGERSVVIAESPTDPLGRCAVSRCSTDERSQLLLRERLGRDCMARSNRRVPTTVAPAGRRLWSVEAQSGRGLVDPGPGYGFGDDLCGGALVVQHDERFVAGTP